jgi:hypothetical protein
MKICTAVSSAGNLGVRSAVTLEGLVDSTEGSRRWCMEGSTCTASGNLGSTGIRRIVMRDDKMICGTCGNMRTTNTLFKACIFVVASKEFP